MENKQTYAQSYIDYKGWNPIINWRIDEIRDILNSTKGYENIEILFEFFQDYQCHKPTFICRIKLFDGANILLKYEWAIQNDDKEESSAIAWNQATKTLMKDIWRIAIDSLRQQSVINDTLSKQQADGK